MVESVRRLGTMVLRGLREALVVVLWLGWWVLWLLVWPLRMAGLLLIEAVMWVVVAYVGLRLGRDAARQLRRAWVEAGRRL